MFLLLGRDKKDRGVEGWWWYSVCRRRFRFFLGRNNFGLFLLPFFTLQWHLLFLPLGDHEKGTHKKEICSRLLSNSTETSSRNNLASHVNLYIHLLYKKYRNGDLNNPNLLQWEIFLIGEEKALIITRIHYWHHAHTSGKRNELHWLMLARTGCEAIYRRTRP